jgi:hypothetical protein
LRAWGQRSQFLAILKKNCDCIKNKSCMCKILY